MKRSIAATVLVLAALTGCGSTPSTPAPATPSSMAAVIPTPVASRAANVASPMTADLCSPGRDMGCGTPDAECATNRLGKQFVLGGVVYTCKEPKPYAWRRD